MTSPAPLTEAEKAVASELALNTELPTSIGVEGFNIIARQVVAVVRPELAAEFYEAMAVATEKNGALTAEGLRACALLSRQSLSLPASKETPNA